MKKILFIFILCILLVGCNKLRIPKKNLIHPIIHVNAISSLGNIGTGTAFVGSYKNKKFIITAAHIVCGAEVIVLCGKNGKIICTVTNFINPNFVDIAILIPDQPIKFSHSYPLYVGKIKNDFPVMAIGYANGTKIYQSIGRYIMDFKIKFGIKKSLILATTCQMYLGMSGGPLFYKNKVIAINTATSVQGIDSTYKKDSMILKKKGLHISIKELLPILDAIIK